MLWADDGLVLVLRNAEIGATDGAPSAVDGEVVIPWAEVAFVQILGGER